MCSMTDIVLSLVWDCDFFFALFRLAIHKERTHQHNRCATNLGKLAMRPHC